jgi:hypothetical protein
MITSKGLVLLMRSTAVSVPLSIKIYPVEIISKSVCFSMERRLLDVLSNNQDFFLKLMTETKLHLSSEI